MQSPVQKTPRLEWPELNKNRPYLRTISFCRRFYTAWIDSCQVIGETPRSGNYILVVSEGPAAGRVFEFDHDGYEFIDEAADVVEYVEKLLKPDTFKLTDIASHMRFIEGDPMNQWWITTLRDNTGHVANTLA